MRLDEIAAAHADRMQFFCIYVQEAHPNDGWQVEANLRDDVIYDAPTTIDARADMAELCALRLNMKMPMLLDNMSDEVDGKYNALPERLYAIDAGGIVRFKSVAGSFGFKPEEWAEAVAAIAGGQNR